MSDAGARDTHDAPVDGMLDPGLPVPDADAGGFDDLGGRGVLAGPRVGVDGFGRGGVSPSLMVPSVVRILGQRFAVEVVDRPEGQVLTIEAPQSHDVLGYCDRSLNKILIRGPRMMAEDKAREVLLHEVLHAIIGTARIDPFGDDENAEENLVSQLAPLLLAALRDNPALVAALLSAE